MESFHLTHSLRSLASPTRDESIRGGKVIGRGDLIILCRRCNKGRIVSDEKGGERTKKSEEGQLRIAGKVHFREVWKGGSR